MKKPRFRKYYSTNKTNHFNMVDVYLPILGFGLRYGPFILALTAQALRCACICDVAIKFNLEYDELF